jgi:hypothetical protein
VLAEIGIIASLKQTEVPTASSTQVEVFEDSFAAKVTV